MPTGRRGHRASGPGLGDYPTHSAAQAPRVSMLRLRITPTRAWAGLCWREGRAVSLRALTWAKAGPDGGRPRHHYLPLPSTSSSCSCWGCLSCILLASRSRGHGHSLAAVHPLPPVSPQAALPDPPSFAQGSSAAPPAGDRCPSPLGASSSSSSFSQEGPPLPSPSLSPAPGPRPGGSFSSS